MMSKYSGAFDDLNKKLPLNTNVVATIRAEGDRRPTKKWHYSTISVSLQYPHRVVGKKVDASGLPYKRLEVDFRKINSKTIADIYPMPSINIILSNLGRAKFSTTIDLKSGYHQIEFAELDRKRLLFRSM